MPMTRESPIKLPRDCSGEEYNRACEFVTKIKEMDKERNHRGIYIRFITAMKLYCSRSLNTIDLKTRLTTIFKNCDVLLADFDRILKGLDTVPRPDVDDVDAWSKIEQLTKFFTALRSVSEEIREEFLKAFTRFQEHGNVLIIKRKVNKVLQDYPCLKREFKRILINQYGLIIQEEIASDEEDDMLEKDMYFHAIKSANEFTMANDKEKKLPPAGVCGAVRRFYEKHDWPYPQESMRDDPKLVVRRILPCLKRKYKDLMLKDERKAFEKVQKVNESLLVFVGKSPEAIYETTEVLSTWKRRNSRSKK